MGKILDISKWQPNVDYKALATECDLAILRVQDGSSVVDGYYAKHAAGCNNNNIPFGVYAFCRYISVEDAKIEARDFYRRATVNGLKPLFFVADVEVKSMSDMRAGTNAFIAELRKLGAKKVGIYIAHHLHDSFKLDYSKADFKWIPRYASDGKSIIKPKYDCDLHQYTDRGKIAGIKTGVDLNRLTGSKTLKWFTEGHEEKKKASSGTKESKPATYKHMYVTVENLNIRKTANPDGKVLGQLHKGDRVQMVSVDKNNWARLNSNGTSVYVDSTFLSDREVPSSSSRVYVVKKGDNLTAIARKYGTTVAAIQKLNNIKDVDVIRAGQKLKV